MEDGREFERDAIVHPGAVVVLPLLDDGSVVLVRNVRRVVGEYLLELPAGTLEPDEAPIECARRELEEETGYRAGIMEPFGEFFTSPGILSERMFAFVAKGLGATKQSLDDGEELSVETHSLGAIRKMLVEGQLHDAKTMAVVGRYLLMRES